MSLAACASSEKENDVVPKPITSSFNQDFSLNYQQQASLPLTGQTELTVTTTDLRYAICPKDSRCFTADFVWPTLSIVDAQGQTQEIQMPSNQQQVFSTSFLDTTSVRANGRRYVLQYTRYQVEIGDDTPQKKDISVVLRVIQPNANGQ